jgi:hypothetical protein
MGLVALAWGKGALSEVELRRRRIVYRLMRVPMMVFGATLLASLSDSPPSNVVEFHREGRAGARGSGPSCLAAQQPYLITANGWLAR